MPLSINYTGLRFSRSPSFKTNQDLSFFLTWTNKGVHLAFGVDNSIDGSATGSINNFNPVLYFLFFGAKPHPLSKQLRRLTASWNTHVFPRPCWAMPCSLELPRVILYLHCVCTAHWLPLPPLSPWQKKQCNKNRHSLARKSSWILCTEDRVAINSASHRGYFSY